MRKLISKRLVVFAMIFVFALGIAECRKLEEETLGGSLDETFGAAASVGDDASEGSGGSAGGDFGFTIGGGLRGAGGDNGGYEGPAGVGLGFNIGGGLSGAGSGYGNGAGGGGSVVAGRGRGDGGDASGPTGVEAVDDVDGGF